MSAELPFRFACIMDAKHKIISNRGGRQAVSTIKGTGNPIASVKQWFGWITHFFSDESLSNPTEKGSIVPDGGYVIAVRHDGSTLGAQWEVTGQKPDGSSIRQIRILDEAEAINLLNLPIQAGKES